MYINQCQGTRPQAFKETCDSGSMSRKANCSSLVSEFLFTFCNYMSAFQATWMLEKLTGSQKLTSLKPDRTTELVHLQILPLNSETFLFSCCLCFCNT